MVDSLKKDIRKGDFIAFGDSDCKRSELKVGYVMSAFEDYVIARYRPGNLGVILYTDLNSSDKVLKIDKFSVRKKLRDFLSSPNY